MIVIAIVIKNNFWGDLDNMKFGKTFEVSIAPNYDFAYKDVKKGKDNFELWDESERDKMAEYLKKNNFKIKEGKYTINQATSFEKALEIFQFEKIQ